jgi:hypothetical protein
MTTTQNPGTPAPRLGADQAKLVLLVGTVVGMVMVAVGVYLTFRWWSYVTGGLQEWHKNWWRLMLCELTVFGGLAVMFVSLQLARSEERTNPGLRRLLYGYNAALSALLVVTILVHLNVLAYFPVWPLRYAHATYDWSGSNLYSLSPASKEFLSKLKEPVTVYVLLPNGDPTLYEVRGLLDNSKVADPNIKVIEYQPDLSREQVNNLVKQYQLPEREGLLVVYGPEGDQKHEFISANDLTAPSFGQRPGDKEKIEFKGESALIKTLNTLSEGQKPVIYFTQGNGELDLNNFDTNKDDVGIGVLKERLGRANYEVKPLELGAGHDKVPDDASVVVVARPTLALPPQAISALRFYLKPSDPKAKKGKLIALFDVVTDTKGAMVHTGLEALLKTEFNVQVDDDRIVAARSRNPLQVPVLGNAASDNPVAVSFQRTAIPMYEVRTVEPAERNGPAPTDYRADIILAAAPGAMIWKETNLKTDVVKQVDSLRTPDRLGELLEKISRQPLPVAVAVSEMGAPSNPADPHAFMNRKQQPQLLVYGDATWATNGFMGEGGLFDLFTASVSWLRDRPDVSSVTDTKERKAFILRPEDPSAFLTRVVFLPLGLLAVGIVGLGGGVWWVRRR